MKFSHTTDMENFFGSIHSSAHFPSKWVKLYILVVLEWEYEDFLHFRNFFKKSKKFKFFLPTRTWGTFLALFTHVPIFHPMKEFVYCSCPGVRIWGFSSFSKNVSKNLKNWSFRPQRTWGTFLAQFTQVPIFHPNEWICIFQLSWSENMRIFFIFENLSKTWKNWSFRPTQICGTILAQFTHVPIFHPNEWSCPGVRIWGYSSFSKTFPKIKKIEVFAHHGPGELFWLNSLMCPFSILMSEFV